MNSLSIKLKSLQEKLGGIGDFGFIFGLFGAVLLLVVPVHKDILSILLVISIAISLLILVTVIYVKDPPEFSVFPTLLLSVTLYVVIPLIAGIVTRHQLTKSAAPKETVTKFTNQLKPISIIALLATIIILFGFQGEIILENPLLIILIAIPLLVQSYGIFFIAYFTAWLLKVPHRIAAPCAMIGTSNFFELAVAVAISLFGLNSGATLVTVVGVLVEVPVMLSLVAFANKTKTRFSTK